MLRVTYLKNMSALDNNVKLNLKYRSSDEEECYVLLLKKLRCIYFVSFYSAHVAQLGPWCQVKRTTIHITGACLASRYIRNPSPIARLVAP